MQVAACVCGCMVLNLGCGTQQEAEVADLGVLFQSVEDKVKKCAEWTQNLAKRVAGGTAVREACVQKGPGDLIKQLAGDDSLETQLDKSCRSATGILAVRSFTRDIKNRVCKDFAKQIAGKCPFVAREEKVEDLFRKKCSIRAKGGTCLVSQQAKQECTRRIARVFAIGFGSRQSREQAACAGNQEALSCTYTPPGPQGECRPTSDFSPAKLQDTSVCQLLSNHPKVLQREVNCLSIRTTGQVGPLCRFAGGTCGMADVETSVDKLCQQQFGLGSDRERTCNALKVVIEGPSQLRVFLQEEVVEQLQQQRQDVQRAFRAGIAYTQQLIEQREYPEAGMYLEEVLHRIYFPGGYDGSLHVLAAYLFQGAISGFTSNKFLDKVRAVKRYCGFDAADRVRCFDVDNSLESVLTAAKQQPWLVPVWEKDVNAYGARWQLAQGFAVPQPTNAGQQGKNLCALVKTGQCVPQDSCDSLLTQSACEKQSSCSWQKEGE